MISDKKWLFILLILVELSLVNNWILTEVCKYTDLLCISTITLNYAGQGVLEEKYLILHN